ncbi:unnamed protein product [Diamesa serratosioi]
MDTIWIISLILSAAQKSANGQSDVEVELIAKRYVEKGSSLTLLCKHNVIPAILYKVSWLKNSGNKFFEYINGRSPPYRNFSIAGAEIDFVNSNQDEVTLKNLDFDAAGLYYCEVSLDAPIFTKASNEEQIHVILPQIAPPNIVFKKRQFFVGENLVANCTTTRARPQPHITWLINGKKVDEIHTRTLHPYGASSKNQHKSKSHQHHEKSELSNVENDESDYNDTINRNGANSHLSQSKSGLSLDNYENTDINFNRNNNNNNNMNNNNNNNNNFNSKTRESNMNFYDNKYYDIHKKHRNAFNKKYRRHITDNPQRNSGGGGNERGAARRLHPGMFSSSQLSIEVSELHADTNGRLEITCLATIPANVDPGEQYADFKTFSVKIDIEAAELTTQPPSMVGMAALGNASNKFNNNNNNNNITHSKCEVFGLLLLLLPT